MTRGPLRLHLSVALLGAAAWALPAQGGRPVASVTVTPAPASVAVGGSITLVATARDRNGNVLAGRTITWSSGNASLATVSGAGVVTGVAVGMVTITATAGGQNGTAGVTVTPPPVYSVTVAPSSVVLFVGTSSRLTATVRDAPGNVLTDRAVAWSTSNATVATVLASGVVTGLAAGRDTITATAETKTGTAAITVTRLPPIAAHTAPPPPGVSVSGDHACLVRSDGAAYCWGQNRDGQLGDSTQIRRDNPVAVVGGQRYQAIRAGMAFSCGLQTAGVDCWGNNSRHQLGGYLWGFRSLTPASVLREPALRSLSAGEDHACAVTSAGVGLCWGSNQYGELGNSATSAASSRPVAVAGGIISFSSVSAGGDHTCGVATDAGIYCWGRADAGQLGAPGTGGCITTGSSVAVPCARKPMRLSRPAVFSSVSAGGSHTCAVSGERVWCWGANSSGQLGDGSLVNSVAPVVVRGPFAFVAVSAGAVHTCGLTANGLVSCWGDNTYGQLGNGTLVSSATPVAVAGSVTFLSVSAGGAATCGVSTSGDVLCWGGFARSSVPVRVNGWR